MPLVHMHVITSWCILIIFGTHSSLYTEIIKHPQDTTVFPNQTATFKCVTNGADIVTVKLNGTRFTDLSQGIKNDCDFKKEINGTHIERTLNIKNASKYNGTTVQCVAYNLGGVPVLSEIATLTIQGITIIKSYVCEWWN